MLQSQPADDLPGTADVLVVPSARAVGGSFAVRLLISCLVTFAAIQFSLRHGRLIHRPMADDASYFVDGLQRLDALYQHGCWGLIRSLAENPPHAPFSSLLAAGSFALFGRHDWSPYAGNAIIVLALLSAVDWLLPSLKRWQRGLVYAMVLGTHWPWTATTEFRPDLATGLVTAVAIIYCLRSRLAGSSFAHRLAVGAWFGLTLVMKPSLSPVNLFLFASCVFIAVGLDLQRWVFRARDPRQTINPAPRIWRPGFRDVVSAIATSILGALLVALPYFAFGWRSTWAYIYSNVFGNRSEIWHDPGARLDQLRFYLDLRESSGAIVLGIGHFYLLALILILGICLVLFGKNREKKLRAIVIVFIGVVAWAIPTLSKTKNPYFGAGFQTLLLLGAVMTVGLLAASHKSISQVVFVVACLASALLWNPPLNRGNPWDYAVANSNRLLDQVYANIQQGGFGDRIFIPAPGDSVSWNTMNYMSLCDDSLRRFTNLDYGAWNDQENILTELDQADWVIVGDPGNDEARKGLPNGSEGLALYLDAVQKRDDFQEVAKYPAYSEKLYHLFRRKTPAFWGFDDARSTGLRPPDGPHPEWRLPAIRAGGAEPTHLQIPAGPGDRTLVLSFACQWPGQAMTLSLDGNHLAFVQCDGSDAFQDLRIPVNLSAGPHELSIDYSDPAAASGPETKKAVLFRKIQFLSVASANFPR